MISTDRIKIDTVTVREDKRIQVTAHCFDKLTNQEIQAFKDSLCRKLNYSQVELVLREAAGENGDTEPPLVPEERLEAFWDAFREHLRVSSPSVWAILEGSCIQLQEDIFQVGLSKNLAPILKMKRTDLAIGKAFEEEFGKTVKVELYYVPAEESTEQQRIR